MRTSYPTTQTVRFPHRRGDATPHDLDVVLDKAIAFRTRILSPQQKAAYVVHSPTASRTQDPRHAGLNFDAYTTFSSPIRRYADLMVHRVAHAILDHSEPLFNPAGGDLLATTLVEQDLLAYNDVFRKVEPSADTAYLQTLVVTDELTEYFEYLTESELAPVRAKKALEVMCERSDAHGKAAGAATRELEEVFFAMKYAREGENFDTHHALVVEKDKMKVGSLRRRRRWRKAV